LVSSTKSFGFRGKKKKERQIQQTQEIQPVPEERASFLRETQTKKKKKKVLPALTWKKKT